MYLFVYLFLSLCLYLNFLPYFSLLDKTPLRYLEAELDTCPSTLTLFITVGAFDAMHCNVYGFFFSHVSVSEISVSSLVMILYFV